MLDFNLTDNETGLTTYYTLPQSWEEVTWDQYEQYTLLNAHEFESAAEKSAAQLAVLARMDIATLEDAGYQLVLGLMSHLGFLTESPKAAPLAHIRVGAHTYYAHKLDLFGETVAYDKIMGAEGMTIEQKIPYILALGLRKRLPRTPKARVKTWFQKLSSRAAVETEATQVEPFINLKEWIDERAKLFAHALNVVQVQALAAFFLGNATSLQNASLGFSKLHPRILRQAHSLERVCHAITAGNWQSGIFAPLLLKSISCYFYLLTRYCNVSNTSAS